MLHSIKRSQNEHSATIWKNANSVIYKVYVKETAKTEKLELLMPIIYFITILIGQISYWPLNLHDKYYETLGFPFWFYQIALVIITFSAHCSLHKFDNFKSVVISKAEKIIEESELSSAQEHLAFSENNLSVLILLFALILTLLFISHTHLDLNALPYLSLYAAFLTFGAALSVTMAYATLINVIVVIRKIYKFKFKQYVHYYPISAKIFSEYNEIFLSGLIRFWSVSLPVLFLSIAVVKIKGGLFMTIVLLVIIGFALFTLYPFYFTKAKIIELKMQTIADVINIRETDLSCNLSNRIAIVKMVQDSPSQISDNYQMLFWSTALAGCTVILEQALTPIIAHLFGA